MYKRFRVLFLVLAVVIFAFSSFSAMGLYDVVDVSSSVSTGKLPDAIPMDVTTYQDIPVTEEFPDDLDDFSFLIVDQPRKGSVSLDEDSFTYVPKKGKTGKDKFTYVVMDEDGNTGDPATVSVTIEKRRSKVTYQDMSDRAGYPAAVCLAENGIYVGRQIGADWFFDPDAEVTRSEFLNMAMRIVDVEIDHSATLTGFSDDAAIPTWAKGYARAASENGLVEGIATENGPAFCGEQLITLQEAAAIMDRLLDVADVYLEETGNTWADQAVANMESVQVVAAGSFGSERVYQPMSMEQVAEMLSAAIGVLEARESTDLFSTWF